MKKQVMQYEFVKQSRMVNSEFDSPTVHQQNKVEGS